MVEYVLREIFPLTSDEDAEQMLPLYNTVSNEMNPYHRAFTTADYRSRFERRGMNTRHFIAVGADGSVLGLGAPTHFTEGANGHLQWLDLFVDPHHRRSGIGRALLAKALEVAVAGGRTVMTIDTSASMPAGAAFCEAVHAEVGLREFINVVDVDTLDIGMLERWRSGGPERAPGYEVLIWEDDYPEEHYSPIAVLIAMAEEDIPLEDLDMAPLVVTEEHVREWVAKTKGVAEFVTVVARHVDSGELVGFSELIRRFSDSETIQTSLTMVHRDHRGHGLGKWIKAVALLRGLERWPDAVRIKTENAMSNDAMVGINKLIGFEPRNTMLSYQVTIDVVEQYLERNAG